MALTTKEIGDYVYSLPKGHIAEKEGELLAHGEHVDLIAGTSFGSHQVRVGIGGEIVDDQCNFSNRFGGGRFIDRNGVLNDRCLSNGMPDPRGTGMGGYNPR